MLNKITALVVPLTLNLLFVKFNQIKKAATLIVPLLLFSATIFAQGKQNPNIIFILADDMGYGDLGCYGQQLIATPNLDALASGGLRFTNYYAGSSVCAPSRESLLTGYHTGHTAIRGNFRLDVEDGNLPMAKDHPSIAEYFKKAGYQTAMFGKWGVGDSATGPTTRGFDHSLCYIDQVKAHDYYPPYLWENDKKLWLEKNKDGSKGTYSHTLFADKTIDYIRNSNKQHPFFLYLPYTIPHGELEIPSDAPYSGRAWTQPQKNYAAMITLLDSDVGRIISALKEKGLYENTLVLFASDNGANPPQAKFFKSNGNLRGVKLDLYEGGIREPLIASWPGKIKAGEVTHRITAAWDVLPTLCEIIGVAAQGKTDGVSFLPLLRGQRQPDDKILYWEYYEYNYGWGKTGNQLPRNYLLRKAIRDGKWKAVKNDLLHNPQAPIELYDLDIDTVEQHNVAAEHPDIIKRMTGLFETCSTTSTYFPVNK